MKSLSGILTTIAIIALSAAFSTRAAAQASASFQASATIVTPLSVAKHGDIEFSNVKVDAATADLAAGLSASVPVAGVIASTATGTVSFASFTVTGNANYAYGITLPASITKSFGNHTLTIGTSINASNNYTLSGSGEGALSIEGKLALATTHDIVSSALAKERHARALAAYAAPDEEVIPEEFPVTIIYN